MNHIYMNDNSIWNTDITKRYEIKEQTSDQLVVAYAQNNQKFQFALLVGGSLLTMLLIFFNAKDIQGFEFAIAGFCLFSLYKIWGSYKLIKRSDLFVFDKRNNSIKLNDVPLAELTDVKEIRLLEHVKVDDNPIEFELNVVLAKGEPIYFVKSTNLDNLRDIAYQISLLSDVAFQFESKAELSEEEAWKIQKLEHDERVKIFEKKYQDKDVLELKKIAKKDSEFAVYARDAARNLLWRKEN